ncbi:hypothetical protein [Saccharopolyspora sp. CA-218241]|uniref:hypothetical protein n=1 Tax=Saccharopolyspora sp. CA-218241 TaxID=3240027 RepID=UPI003D965644
MSDDLRKLLLTMQAAVIGLGAMAQNLECGHRPTAAQLTEQARTAELLATRLHEAAGTGAPLVIDSDPVRP